MAGKKKSKSKDVEAVNQWPGIDSQFRLIILAALRSKQLVRGSLARIEPNPLRRKNTSIALEEVKRGLILFTASNGDPTDDPGGSQSADFV